MAIWLQALELASDHSRFDLVLLILGKLVKKKLEIQDWLLIATSMANPQDTIKKGQADVSLGQAYLKIRQQLRGPQVGLVKVRSRLSLSASDSFFLANEHVLSVQAAQLATDPAHRASAAYRAKGLGRYATAVLIVFFHPGASGIFGVFCSQGGHCQPDSGPCRRMGSPRHSCQLHSARAYRHCHAARKLSRGRPTNLAQPLRGSADFDQIDELLGNLRNSPRVSLLDVKETGRLADHQTSE